MPSIYNEVWCAVVLVFAEYMSKGGIARLERAARLDTEQAPWRAGRAEFGGRPGLEV